MDPVSWAIIGAVAIGTGVATYFITHSSASTADEHLKEQINNQIVIQQERDNLHEFAQTIILCLLLIAFITFAVYFLIKCAVNAVYNNRQQQNQQQIDV